MEKGYVVNDKVKLYYEDSQTLGVPILFLHGNGEDSTYFDCIKEFFIKKYHVINIDTRNHGKSSIVENDLNFDVIASDIINVLDKLNLKNLHVVGFSDGASAAISLALKDNTFVKSLILVGANFLVSGMKDETIALIKEEIELLKYKRFFNGKLRNKYRLNKLMLTHPNFDIDALINIDKPSLNIAGDNDCIKIEHTKALTNILKSKEIIFGKASHDLIKEYPKDFYEVVDEFIENLVSQNI